MSNLKVSIIIPTRKRSSLLIPRLRCIERNTPELRSGGAELIYVVDEDDPDSRSLLEKNNHRLTIVPKLTTPANKWNHVLPDIARGEWLVTLSDDSAPHPNWLTNALVTKNYGFLALPDQNLERSRNQFTPLYMATREWLRKFNGGVLVLPVYGIWYADIETCFRAQKSLTYTVAWNSMVEQLHADYGSAPDDETYAIGRARRISDLKIFEERQRQGFPDNFERIL